MLESYIQQCNDAVQRRDMPLLLRLSTEMRETAEREHDETIAAWAKLFDGMRHSMSENYDSAFVIFNEVLLLFTHLNDQAGIGRTLLNIGRIHLFRSDKDTAYDFYEKSLEIELKRADSVAIMRVVGNINSLMLDQDKQRAFFQRLAKAADQMEQEGHIYAAADLHQQLAFHIQIALSDAPLSIEHGNKALLMFEALGDESGIAQSLDALGGAYWYLGEAGKSAEFVLRAVHHGERCNDPRILGRALTNAAYPFMQLEDYNKVLELNQRALALCDEHQLYDNKGWAEMGVGLALLRQGEPAKALEHSLRAIESLTISSDIHGLGYAYSRCGEAYVAMNKYEDALIAFNKSLENRKMITGALEISETQADIAKILLHNGETDKAVALLYEALEAASQISAKAVMFKVHQTLAEAYAIKNEYQSAFQNIQKYIELRGQVQDQETAKRAANIEYLHKQEIHKREQEATDRILNNVLPRSVSDRLKDGHSLIADNIPAMSVIFADIVGFTPIASELSAEELVRLLAHVFGRFDEICTEHGLEKIKTIGDAYMAVAGAPDACDDHAVRCAYAAIKMLDDIALPSDLMPSHMKDTKIKFRIGIHTGSAVAGVIGERRFAYDLWGDAVNTAARMESHGESGKIHVTDDFVRELRLQLNGKFDVFSVTERGELDVKGKGAMRTFYLQEA